MVTIKILLAGFHQEINSFAPGRTTIEHFKAMAAVYGEEELQLAAKHQRQNVCTDMLAAAYRVLTEAKADIVPGGFLYAQSGSIIKDEVLDDYVKQLTDTVKANVPFDGAVLIVHGAAQSESCEDPEGRIIAAVREILGDKAVITVGCDLHTCITEKMVKNANAVCAFQQYPHIDMYETGLRAATLAVRMLKGEIKPYMVMVNVPMIVPASGYTTGTKPFSDIMEEGKRLMAEGSILDYSMFQMQPWLDVSVGGSGALVIAEDKKKAEKIALDFAARLYGMRHSFKSDLTAVDDIIAIAEKNTTDKPVIVNDFADSSNAGAAGDSAEVLDRIIKLKSDVSGLMYINDPDLALKCREVGVGNRIAGKMGGWCSGELYPPVDFEGTVKALYDGKMSFTKGAIADFGPSAAIQVRNTVVIVTTHHRCNGDTRLYKCYGYDPMNFQLVVVKACTSFRAFYGPLTDLIYPAATKGPASSDLPAFPFKNIDKTKFYPFVDKNFTPEVTAYGKLNF